MQTVLTEEQRNDPVIRSEQAHQLRILNDRIKFVRDVPNILESHREARLGMLYGFRDDLSASGPFTLEDLREYASIVRSPVLRDGQTKLSRNNRCRQYQSLRDLVAFAKALGYSAAEIGAI